MTPERAAAVAERRVAVERACGAAVEGHWPLVVPWAGPRRCEPGPGEPVIDCFTGAREDPGSGMWQPVVAVWLDLGDGAPARCQIHVFDRGPHLSPDRAAACAEAARIAGGARDWTADRVAGLSGLN